MKKFARKALALILIISVISTVFIMPVSGADVNGWFFFKGGSTTATIVEGQSIKMELKQPNGMILSPADSLIMKTDSDEDVPITDGKIEITNPNAGEYYIVANDNSSGTYKIQGNFYSKTMTGAVVISHIWEETDPETGEIIKTPFQGSATVKSAGSVPITQDSSISIKCTSVVNGTPQLMVSGVPTGAFINMNNVTIEKTSNYVGNDDYKFVYTLHIYNQSAANFIELQLTTKHEIGEGTTARMDFTTEKSEYLILNVRSKQELVNEVAAAIGQKTQRDPYIEFAGADSPDYVTQNFKKIASRVEVHGVTVDIKWEWTVDGKENDSIILFDTGSPTLLGNKVTRKKQDVVGLLNYVVSYVPSGSTEPPVTANGALQLTVKGTGVPPGISGIENMLDINDGTVEGFPAQAPNYADMQISMGQDGGYSSYVVITSSNTDAVDLLLKDENENEFNTIYSWGNQIQNPNQNVTGIDTIPVKLVPKNVGETEITAIFYSNLSSDGVVRVVRTVKFKVTVVDTSPNGDPTLMAFDIYTDEGEKLEYVFNPATESFTIDVGNWVQYVKVVPWVNDPAARDAKTNVELTYGGEVQTVKHGSYSKQLILGEESGSNEISVKVWAQNPNITQTYLFNIYKLPKSNDAKLAGLEVHNEDNELMPYTPDFAEETKEYAMSVPYKTQKLYFKAATSHRKATVAYSAQDKDGNIIPFSKELFTGREYLAIDNDIIKVDIIVTAEDGETKKPYSMVITRQPPETSAILTSLDITDNNQEKVEINYDPLIYDYELEVDYAVSYVSVVPTAESQYATILLNNEEVISGAPARKRIELEVGKVTPIVVDVTAQDGVTTRQYVVKLKRMPASTDASLVDLKVGDLTLDPEFSPENRSYRTDATGKATSVTVTPTASHRYATIKVNRQTVKSGEASSEIKLNSVTVITVTVTAQDGKTTAVYKVQIVNDDLRVKNDDADLKMLKVNEGKMSPNFKASITTYNVPVEDDVDYIDIIPIPKDERATVVVKQGSKEIGDHEGNFSQALKNGANKFTIEVTADDGKTKKTYSLSVNKGVKGQEGTLKPIGPDVVDVSKSPVTYVDITKYTVVSSKLFAELAKYPDHTIVFVGTDYSLAFKGSDLNMVVPFEETYNFAMSFSSPNEFKIRELLGKEGSANYSTPFITLYFKHHGALPGRATLMVDLGTKYRNRTFYVHYYNQEFNRNEYYGKTNSNARGTVKFKIDHFSDYILAYKVLPNSFDKSGEVNIGVSDSDRYNPNTGEQND